GLATRHSPVATCSLPLATATGAAQRGLHLLAVPHLLERHRHLARPARVLLGADAGEVHGVDLPGEVVERNADERRRRATQKLVDRAAERCVVRRSPLWGDPLLRQAREQRLLVSFPLVARRGRR